jgi:hypothetical protein
MTSLTPQEKKAWCEKKMQEGDKRSYNELKADLELTLWTERMKSGFAPIKQKQLK